MAKPAMNRDAIALAKAAIEQAGRASPAPWWTSDLDGNVMSGDEPDHAEVGDADWVDEDLHWAIAARTREPILAAALLDAHRALEEMRAARDELADIAWTYVMAYLHTEPGQRDKKSIAALRAIGVKP